jgi:hypothetical protein
MLVRGEGSTEIIVIYLLKFRVATSVERNLPLKQSSSLMLKRKVTPRRQLSYTKGLIRAKNVVKTGNKRTYLSPPRG